MQYEGVNTTMTDLKRLIREKLINGCFNPVNFLFSSQNCFLAEIFHKTQNLMICSGRFTTTSFPWFPLFLLSHFVRADEIRGVWIAHETRSREFDISSQSNQKSRSKRRSKIVKIYA